MLSLNGNMAEWRIKTSCPTDLCSDEWPGADLDGDAHGIRDVDVFALNIRPTEPVDRFVGARLVRETLTNRFPEIQ